MAKIYIKSINEWIATTTTKTSTLTDAHSRTTVTVFVLVRSTTTATWTVTVANIMFQMIQARLTVHMKMKTEMKPVW